MENNFYNQRPPGNYRPRFQNRSRGFSAPRMPYVQRTRPPYLCPPFGMTPEGFRLPAHMQAPPMFGPRGATIPPRMMQDSNKYSKPNNHFHKGPQNGNHQDKYGNDSHWCETCDRGFKSLEVLEKHKAEHQKCGIDGCNFIAHPNVVTKHIQMQHSSGLYNKIKNINTPEEIEEWIKERKKNYPSKENIEKKKAQQKECFDRGEKLKGNQNRFNNRRSNDNNNKFGNKTSKFRDRRNNNKFTSESNVQKKPVENKKNLKINDPPSATKTPLEDKHCKISAFKGISGLLRHDLIDNEVPSIINDIDVEDKEWQETNVSINNPPPNNISVCSALSNLISAYDSSSDDESGESKKPCLSTVDNEKAETNITGHEKSVDNNLNTAGGKNKKGELIVSDTCLITHKQIDKPDLNLTNLLDNNIGIEEKSESIVNDESDGSGPEEKTIDKSNGVPQIVNGDLKINNRQNRKRKHSNNHRNKDLDKNNPSSSNSNQIDNRKPNIPQKSKGFQPVSYKRRIPPTLLEKLLENDIRHERNIILQCINYIVKEGFFEKPK